MSKHHQHYDKGKDMKAVPEKEDKPLVLFLTRIVLGGPWSKRTLEAASLVLNSDDEASASHGEQVVRKELSKWPGAKDGAVDFFLSCVRAESEQRTLLKNQMTELGYGEREIRKAFTLFPSV